MDNNELLNENEFEIFLNFSKKHNPATKHDYLSKILLFKDFIKNKELIEVDKGDCKLFMEFVSQNYAKSTSEKIYSYLHSFYNFMKKCGKINSNPFKLIKKPEVSRIKTKDDVLSIQEINQLINTLPRLNPRDRLIIVFLVTTGCMLNELVNVKWKDLMLDENNNVYIKLGKGKKERVVKLHPFCFKSIEEYRFYLGLESDIKPVDKFIFITQKSDSITDRNVRIIVKKALDLAGLSNYSSKDFRHSFAAISLRLGAGEEDIKNQLGWSDKHYAIRYKYVLNFVDSESVDYFINNDKMNINKK